MAAPARTAQPSTALIYGSQQSSLVVSCWGSALPINHVCWPYVLVVRGWCVQKWSVQQTASGLSPSARPGNYGPSTPGHGRGTCAVKRHQCNLSDARFTVIKRSHAGCDALHGALYRAVPAVAGVPHGALMPRYTSLQVKHPSVCAEETTQISYEQLREVRSVNRGLGLWGDMVRDPCSGSSCRLQSPGLRHTLLGHAVSQLQLLVMVLRLSHSGLRLPCDPWVSVSGQAHCLAPAPLSCTSAY